MIGIDKYAYNSKLSRVKASEKFFFSIIPLLICLIANSKIVSAVTLVAMGFATISMGGFCTKRYLKFLLIPSSFLVIGVITIIINKLEPASAGKLFYFEIFNSIYGITTKSLNLGITLYLKSLASISCLYFFSLNTPMNSIFNFLRKLKLPILIIELMELIYRFIFIVWEQASKIHIAQSSRLGYNGFKRSIKSLAELVSMVFIKSMNRVERIDIALESRGFDGNFIFLIEEEKESKEVKYFGGLLIIALIAIIVIERVIK